MTSASAELSLEKASPMRILLATGALVATLDLIFVFVFWRGVARRRRASCNRSRPASSAPTLIGWTAQRLARCRAALLHRHRMVLAYYLVSRHWRALVAYPYRFGLLYGVWLYVCMTYIVVPLSVAPPLRGEGRAGAGSSSVCSCICCWSVYPVRSQARRALRARYTFPSSGLTDLSFRPQPCILTHGIASHCQHVLSCLVNASSGA